MNVPISWLRDYVNFDCDIKKFCDALTLSGSKVEGITRLCGEISGVVAGRILSLEKHPNGDKLQIAAVDTGGSKPLQIVTGATNVFPGALVPVALPGAALAGGVHIEESELRGIKSSGMLCSIEELGCDAHDFPDAPEHGIYIINETVSPGADICDALDLRDDVVEFEITSNRPDCFSITGIAREAAATLDKNFKLPGISLKEKGGGNASELVSVEIKNPEYCLRYAARIIKNARISPSPRWMRKRLRAAGIRPINNIVDITNYVMVELGQPMHAFDIDEIDERKIIVRNAYEGEKFTTLDGIARTLDPEMTMIADINKAVGIGGVMGGLNSRIGESASGVLLESACFNGPNIRVTAKKLGLRTDASSKFEKGLDPNMSLYAVNRAAELVELLDAGDVVSGIVDCYPEKREPRRLSFSAEWINRLLGTDIPEDEMIRIFEKLEIKTDGKNKTVTVPTFRPDLEAQADLAEEAARMYGYDRIPVTLAAGTPTVGKMTYTQSVKSLIKTVLTHSGLSETLNFTFESPKVFGMLGIPVGHKLRETVEISNPLGEDFSIMRTTTLNGMLTSLSTNFNRRNPSAALFEMGKVYIPKSLPLTELPEEKEIITVGMYGSGDFYSLKGILEKLMNVLGINVSFAPEKDIPWMHPGRTAAVTAEGIRLGYMGELHPDTAENFEIGARVYLAVLESETLVSEARMVRTCRPLPKFPAVIRDISMLVDEGVLVGDIESIIRENGGEYLESIDLFDVYTGSQISGGQKSVAFSMTFRSATRTLEFSDVNKEIKNILDALKTRIGASLRDR